MLPLNLTVKNNRKEALEAGSMFLWENEEKKNSKDEGRHVD